MRFGFAAEVDVRGLRLLIMGGAEGVTISRFDDDARGWYSYCGWYVFCTSNCRGSTYSC